MKIVAKRHLLTLLVLAICAALTACDSGDNAGDQGNGQIPTDPSVTDPSVTDPGNTDPGNTDPGNTDPGNTDPVDATKHVVKMSVEYAGPKMGNLVVGLFTNFPPTAPPVAFTQEQNVTFPTNISVADVPAGTYFGLVVLDVAPFDPMTQGPEDLSVVVTVDVPSADAVSVLLVDADEPTPAPEKSDVILDIVYTGAQTGNLVIGFFDTWPAQGPPVYYAQEANPAFPQEMVVADVEPGQYTALIMLDAEPYDPGVAGPEDRMTTVQINPPLAGKVTVTIPDEPAGPVGDPTNPPGDDPGDDPGDTEPGNDPAEPPAMDPNGANVKVIFDGANADGNLVLAMFDMWPPMGPPKKVKEINNVAFPAYAVVSDVAAGQYTTVVTLDRAPFNPSSPGPEDVKTNVEINIPTGANWVEVVLVDPFEDLEVGEIDYNASSDIFVSNSNPYGPGELAVTTTEVAAGMNGAPVDMLVMTPEIVDGDFPIIVFQHGFIMAASNYSEVLAQIASHGFVVVAPQMYEAGGLPIGKPSTEEESVLAVDLYNWLDAELEGMVNVNIDITAMGLAGHSRGGKIAWAALLQDTGLAVSVAGIDPVDGSEGPFATDSKMLTGPVPFSMPSLVIGTGLGQDKGIGGFAPACAPEGQNHVQFYSALPSPAWHVVVNNFGHNDMLNDEGCGFECLACPSGGAKAVMRKTVAGLLTAFFRGSLAGVEGEYALLEDPNSAPTAITTEWK